MFPILLGEAGIGRAVDGSLVDKGCDTVSLELLRDDGTTPQLHYNCLTEMVELDMELVMKFPERVCCSPDLSVEAKEGNFAGCLAISGCMIGCILACYVADTKTHPAGSTGAKLSNEEENNQEKDSDEEEGTGIAGDFDYVELK